MTDTTTEQAPPAQPETTAKQTIIEALTTAQRNWLALDGDALDDSTAMKLHIHQAAASFGTALFLDVLSRFAPIAAESAAQQYREALQDGAGVGEWTWELLTKYGVDPDSIKPAADPRADLREELDRVKGVANALHVTVREMLAAHDNTETEWGIRTDEQHKGRTFEPVGHIRPSTEKQAVQSSRIWAGWTPVARVVGGWHPAGATPTAERVAMWRRTLELADTTGGKRVLTPTTKPIRDEYHQALAAAHAHAEQRGIEITDDGPFAEFHREICRIRRDAQLHANAANIEAALGTGGAA